MQILHQVLSLNLLIGARSVAWAESSITQWIKEKIEAANPKSKAEPEWDDFDKKAVAKARAIRDEIESI